MTPPLLSAPRPLHFVATLLALAGSVAGCSSGATSTASSAAPGSSAAPITSAGANQEPLKKGLLGGLQLTEVKSEVESRDKKKIAFSIELPEGLKDFSDADFAGMKSFSRVKHDLENRTTFDGYSFSVMSAPPEMAKAGVEATLARDKADLDKNKGKILDKGSNSDGWWFAASIEEKDKKAVISMGIVTKGDVNLMCRGNFQGPGAEKAEEIGENLVKVCKTLTINGG